MNRLVIKLLRQHLSGAQLLGFFFANLLGMTIVMLSWQFYVDVLPVFTQGDSFMKETYLVIGKRVTAAQTLMGHRPSFSETEISDLEQQPFVKGVGRFVPAQFDVHASVGSGSLGIGMSTDMFFESIPDEYVDADLSQWHYEEGGDSIPIILPRNYLHLYNFGFASSRGLPVLSEGLIGMIKMQFRLRGTQGERFLNGRVVAFSNRLNTILVPQQFMEEANSVLSPERNPVPSRLILKVDHLADREMATYFSSHHYEEEGNAADTGKMAYFLRLVVGIVLSVGLIICALSFYVLLLSIYLLLQRHTEKIDNLLLIGYSPDAVAQPFHVLSIFMNLSVVLISFGGVALLRSIYLPLISQVYPQLETGTLLPAFCLGFSLFVLVTVLNYLAIRRKVMRIWYIHQQ